MNDLACPEPHVVICGAGPAGLALACALHDRGLAVRVLEQVLGKKAGASTGTGLWSALRIVAEMRTAGRTGSVVTLICDPGDRYLDKYYSDAWLAGERIDIAPYRAAMESFLAGGAWTG